MKEEMFLKMDAEAWIKYKHFDTEVERITEDAVNQCGPGLSN